MIFLPNNFPLNVGTRPFRGQLGDIQVVLHYQQPSALIQATTQPADVPTRQEYSASRSKHDSSAGKSLLPSVRLSSDNGDVLQIQNDLT